VEATLKYTVHIKNVGFNPELRVSRCGRKQIFDRKTQNTTMVAVHV